MLPRELGVCPCAATRVSASPEFGEGLEVETAKLLEHPLRQIDATPAQAAMGSIEGGQALADYASILTRPSAKNN